MRTKQKIPLDEMEFWRTSDLAAVLGVSRRTLGRMVDQDLLPERITLHDSINRRDSDSARQRRSTRSVHARRSHPALPTANE